MKLNQMYRNVLTYTMEELVAKIEEDSIVRAERIQSMSKIDASGAKKARLDDAEKAILKSLGLSMKDIKSLQGSLI